MPISNNNVKFHYIEEDHTVVGRDGDTIYFDENDHSISVGDVQFSGEVPKPDWEADPSADDGIMNRPSIFKGTVDSALRMNTTDVASGVNSFAEGSGTIASGTNQHVGGTYNIADQSNKYAMIIGNGSDESNRSNAFAIDWDGKIHVADDQTGIDIRDLQTEITSQNMLSADLVNDTSSTNKFVTASDKSTWSGKQDAITSQSMLSSDLVDDTNHDHKFVTSAEKTKIANALTSEEYDAGKTVPSGTSVTISGTIYTVGEHAEIFNDYDHNLAVGQYSHAEGRPHTHTEYDPETGEPYLVVDTPVVALGTASHAEGYATQALDDAAHSEGYKTVASGSESHAEGRESTASGSQSHSEGSSTVASGDCSHSEGSSTTASGNRSHAEGSGTVANTYEAHAEGNNTTAGTHSDYPSHIGTQAHAEGSSTIAVGVASHAEGSNTTVSGDYGHSEGDHSVAHGVASHAEGYYTTANLSAAHSEGDHTSAYATNSHAEGHYTVVSQLGTNSHAEGDSSQCDTECGHVEGYHTSSNGGNVVGSHVEGYYSSVSVGVASGVHAEGFRTYVTGASGTGTHIEGASIVDTSDPSTVVVQQTANGIAAHVEGEGNVGQGEAIHAEGYRNVLQWGGSHVSGYNNTVAINPDSTDPNYNPDITVVNPKYVIGKYNDYKYDDFQNTAFVIGNGTADNARSNCFSVDFTGNVKASGKITVGYDPTASMEVATKNYVDSKISSVQSSIGQLFSNYGQLTTMIWNLTRAIAPSYNSSNTYAVGDVCTNGQDLYRCLSSTTGTWDDTAWEKISVIDLI